MFKCECLVADLVKQVKKCLEIVPSASPSPILSNIKINFTDSGLDLFATDLDAGAVGTVDTTQTIMPKDTTVVSAIFDAKMLNSIIGAFQSKDVVLMYDEATHKLLVSSDKQEMAILGRPANDFPELIIGSKDQVAIFEVPSVALQALVNNVSWALPDKSMIELNYIYFKLSGGDITAYASNKKVLAKYTVNAIIEDGEDCTFVLPPKVLLKIAKHKIVEEMASVVVKSDVTVICVDDMEYRIRTSSAPFPGFDALLENLPENKLKVVAANLENDLKSILPIANEDFCAISIKTEAEDGCIVMNAHSGESYSGTVKTKVKDIFGGVNGEYNAKQLLGALTELSGEMTMSVTEKKQLYFVGEDDKMAFVYAFMPLARAREFGK